MKVILCIATLFLISCGNNSGTDNKTATDSAKKEIKDPEADKGLQLISKADCFGCHKLNEASIGPSYAAVHAKYKTINPQSMDSMVSQIINGGSGRWGTVPMPAHIVTNENAQSMVHYIMSVNP